MFIKSHSGNRLVNTDNILTIDIVKYMDGDAVYCNVEARMLDGHISPVLFRGTEDACHRCMDRIMEEVNKR